MNRFDKLWQKFRSRNYRQSFMSARVADALAGQIIALRKRRGWTQGKLSEKAEMKQSQVSQLEAGYESFTFSTLKRIAAALNVAVIVQFVSFPNFIRWSQNFDASVLAPDDFSESEQALRREEAALAQNPALARLLHFETNGSSQPDITHMLASLSSGPRSEGKGPELPTPRQAMHN